MCMAKSPKPVNTAATTEKPLPVLRNPFIDGIDPMIAARRTGTSSLRIDRGAPRTRPTSGRINRPAPQSPTSTGGGSSTNPGGTVSSSFDTLSRLPGAVGTYARHTTAQQRASY